MSNRWGCLLAIAIGGAYFLGANCANAQITPDGTLPSNSSVTQEGNTFNITGGTEAGSNLFHSFQQFSIPTNNTAFFDNAGNIQNIISRVTGGSISNIDGIIQANGTANLFFINPNGIIFGPDASLAIGGSFVASTANSLRFADGTEFSATNPQAPPLLTVNVPIGLQFGPNPGGIINQSQASPNEAVNSFGLPVGLQVQSGKTLALVGGDVSLQGGNLTTAGGRIELGSVGTGLVNLTEIPQGYALGYAGVQNLLNIDLSGGATVDASGEGGGDIQVQGRNINLTGDAAIFSTTLGAGTGGNLTVDAAESVKLNGNLTELSTSTLGIGSAGNLTITTRNLIVEGGAVISTPSLGEGRSGDLLVRASDAVKLIGTTADGQNPSGIFAQVAQEATGDGGNLTIETGRLTIQDGAAVDASTFGARRAGNVLVRASDNIDLVGRSPDAQFPSGIFAQVGEGGIGNAGTLTIETQRLTVLGGAQISTAARTGGNGGDLTINALESIKLSGTSPTATLESGSSGIFVSAQSGARGNVGNLNINSGLLTVENGARISANNRGSGEGGTLTLNVRQLTIRNGGLVESGSFANGAGGTLTVNARSSVQVIGTGTIGSTSVVSTLSTSSQASGNAGNLNITTPSLNVQDGAEVTVSGTGSGSAGNLTVRANTIRLNRGSLTATIGLNQESLTATTNAAEGANIRLQDLDLLLMQNHSLISAQAFNNANGGNINIDAANGFVVAVPGENNDIIANAVQGQGGEINITTTGIFGIEERSATPPNTTNDIDASSEFGLAGNITINRPEVDPSRGLVELPSNLVDASQQIATGCTPDNRQQASSFVVTGRGGIAPSPTEPLVGEAVIANWVTLPEERVGNSGDRRSGDKGRRGEGGRVGETRGESSPHHPITESASSSIVEAQGWIVDANGDIILVAQAPTVNTLSRWLSPASCYAP